MLCSRVERAAAPMSTGGLEVSMGSPACAAAAYAFDGQPGLGGGHRGKQGKHKLGAGAARQPSPLARTRGSSLRSCAGAAKETQRWAGTLLAAAAAAAPTKPTEPQRSLRGFCSFGFPAVAFTRRACRGACVASNEGKINIYAEIK